MADDEIVVEEVNNEEFKGERKQTAWTDLEYHSGFGNHHESEAVKGSLVRG
jgi:hypothetical protein